MQVDVANAQVADLQVTSSATRVRDAWDLPLTCHAPKAAAAYDRAVFSLLAHRADTLSQLDEALRIDPLFALPQLIRGFAMRLLCRADLLPSVREALRNAERSFAERGSTLREALIADALRTWCAGDVDGAIASLSRCSEAHPGCLVSMKLHHALCFLHGKHQLMRRALERTLAQISPELPGYSYVLGCQAFALEETGAYGEALRHARIAIEHCPHDAWAYHALLHVLSMQDQNAEGLRFVRLRGQRFLGGNNFVAHIAWHHALFAIAEGELDEALSLYDGEISSALGRDYRDLANCASLLYRLSRAGVAVGQRWEALADLAEPRVGDHQLAFADAHYLLALLGAGRHERAAQFVAGMREASSARIDHDALVVRRVGLPLADGMVALFAGKADQALYNMWPLGARTLRLGGSHAQRELFEQLAVDAALASGRPSMAERLLSEQLEARPHCQWARARMSELSTLHTAARAQP
jgi:tetratricopeptide (TPR) repeat protein